MESPCSQELTPFLVTPPSRRARSAWVHPRACCNSFICSDVTSITSLYDHYILPI